MPARPTRNAQKTKPAPQTPDRRRQPQLSPQQQQQQHRTSPPLSPPTQLPTPLPEEHEHVRSSGVMDAVGGLGLAFSRTDNDDDISRMDGELGRLIDFGTPPTGILGAVIGREYEYDGELDAEPEGELDGLDLMDSAVTYRSPPFREALLPPEDAESSPPPLPVPPRYTTRDYFEDSGEEDYGGSLATVQGHRREPVLARSGASPSRHARSSSFSPSSSTSPSNASALPNQPLSRYPSTASTSTFESFSRTIRGYVPSSMHIPVPTAAPSPPLVSRPVVSVSRALFSGDTPASPVPAYPSSTGGYGGPQAQGAYALGYAGQGPGSRRQVEQQEFERDYERAQPDDAAEYYGYGYGHSQSQSPVSPPGHAGPYQPQATHAVPSPRPGSRSQGALQQQQYGVVSPSAPPHQQHQSSQRSFPGSGLAQAIRRGAAAGLGRAPSAASGSHAQAVRHRRAVSTSAAGGPHGHQWQGQRQDGGQGQPDVITWARWDTLNERRILLLAYISGLQIWDTSALSSVTEMLNLNFDTNEWALLLDGGGSGQAGVRVVHSAVLPSKDGNDSLRDVRPLLGILMESEDTDERELEPRSTFVIYSLRTHQVVKLLSLPGLAHSFVPNENFVVISTTTPPTLHILSSMTFHTLHTISSSSLEPFAPPLASHSSSSIPSSAISITNAISATASTHIHATLSNKSVSLPGLSIDNTNSNDATSGSGGSSPVDRRSLEPHPVFALSHRLLAYASPSPAQSSFSPSLLAVSSKASRRLSSSSAGSGPSHASSSSLSSSPFGLGLGKITNMTQADVGHAALKVGETMFSGMKFLGGMALEAAKSRVTPAAGPEGRAGAYPRPLSQGGSSPASGSGGKFVSRSAPDTKGAEEAAQALRERRYSNTSNVSGWDQRTGNNDALSSGETSPHPNQHLTTVAPHTKPVAENGHYVTVLDLMSLLSGRKGAAPRKVDEFSASRSQMVVDLKFAADGTSLAVALRNGHAVRVFKLHPAPSVMLRAQAAILTALDIEHGAAGTGGDTGRRATQVYELYRGRTTAIVEDVDWTKDGRWFGVGTRNRTIHVFPVNPYGGKSDIRSHIEGRVRNVEVTGPHLLTMTPLARLRGSKNPSPDHIQAPLTFTFLAPSDLSSSPDLQFPFAQPNITNSPTFSPPKVKHGTNYQDVLVFDPADGVLSLRRLTIEKRAARDQSLSGGMVASVQALGVTSISLPGMGGAGRLSSSPSNTSASKTSSPVVDPPMELVAKETVEATWNLKRGRDWVEIKRAVQPRLASAADRRAANIGADWLAEGEILTCSSSTRVLPRSLYLSHQFSFQSLGEDYHALIRRYQFDIPGNVVEVRKAVEISAYSSGGGDSSFVEGFSSPRDIRRASSSFDEPIASAISGSLDSSHLPAILPMYPNGIPGSKPKSFRNSIPIRTMAGIGDGVSEGIGRIRREMHKARSPQLVARSDASLSGPVPLEFDEEDEDFLNRDTLQIPGPVETSTSRDTSRDNASAESRSSLVTPANSITQHLMDADVVGSLEEMWNGWDPQDKLAIEEAEQYDEIAAVGFVDDEPKYQPQPPPADAGSKRKGRQKRR